MRRKILVGKLSKSYAKGCFQLIFCEFCGFSAVKNPFGMLRAHLAKRRLALGFGINMLILDGKI
jgi:hypothetical protein